MRVLDREADLETRFGGGFVQSIDGIEGDTEDGRSLDWFFYVNGIESSVGAAEVAMRPGDRIWWDYRDWTDAMRVPAVVGSWPEPFAQESQAGEPARCGWNAPRDREGLRRGRGRLEDAGGRGRWSRDPARVGAAVRVLVGPWEECATDPAARLLDAGPSASGVFAGFERERRRPGSCRYST